MERSMKKEAARPHTGTFYLIGETIAFTLDTGDEDAIDHYQLWDFVVDKVFTAVDFQTRQELKQDAVYGCDRGRVVFKGERSPTGAMRGGTFALYGTPECKRFESRLKKLFGFEGLPKTFDVEVDFKSDPHYKVQPADKRALDAVISASDLPRHDVRIAGWKRNPKPKPDVKIDKE